MMKQLRVTLISIALVLAITTTAWFSKSSSRSSSRSSNRSNSSPNSTSAGIHSSKRSTSTVLHEMKMPLAEIEMYLHSVGYSLDSLCQHHYHEQGLHQQANADVQNPHLFSMKHRTLQETATEGNQEENESLSASSASSSSTSFMIQNTIMAMVCVTIAALAAGLTMGLLSLELLDLRIKEMASSKMEEREQAKSLVPLIQDHHRLLVTLLLMNALANEALPLFLDKLVPSYVAVLLSVTLVLFFGEIIPSAIFTGPNQLSIASKLAPLVKLVLFLLAPIAWPIASLLDFFLHGGSNHSGGDDGHGGHSGGKGLEKYDRRELGALVRLQFESRKNAKMIRKHDKSRLGDVLVPSSDGDDDVVPASSIQRSSSKSQRYVKHIDEVNMVEGALQMHTKTVHDVMQPWKNVYVIPEDMVLDESNIVHIYSKGYSRIPVYETTTKGDNNTLMQTKRIKGLFKSRQLAVISAQEQRNLKSVPLAKPFCVSPQMNMVDLLNLLQAGKGHMAIVCLKPQIAIEALENGLSIPSTAQVIGLVTLEDCIEELIQEEIFDEYDKQERITHERMKRVVEKWKKYVSKRKKEREGRITTIGEQDVTSAEETFQNTVLETMKNERTRLLP